MEEGFQISVNSNGNSQPNQSSISPQPPPNPVPDSQPDWDAWLMNSNPTSGVNSNQTSRANTPSVKPTLSNTSNPTSSNSRIFSRGAAPTTSNDLSSSNEMEAKDDFERLLPPGFTLPPPPSAPEIPDPIPHSNPQFSKSSTSTKSIPNPRDLLSDDGDSAFTFDPNQDFFSAFSKATPITTTRAPSPPIIDLRETERKLDKERGRTSNGKNKEEDDFFSSFEKAPSESMKNIGRNSSFRSQSLEGENLENLGEAQSSPMKIPGHGNGEDYFQGDGVGVDASSNSNESRKGSWSGSLRKTWSNLKGSLPNASDFLVMEDGEGGEWNPSTSPISQTRKDFEAPSNQIDEARRGSNNSNGSSNSKSPQPKVDTPKQPIQQFPRASEHSGSAYKSPSRKNSTHHAPISGAPGFSSSSTPHWNTGSWTLEDSPPPSNSTFPSNISSNPHPTTSKPQPRREIKVTLSDRREETTEVITAFHSSRLQSCLPPRLQLGRNWKLLYSMDQHGISLTTLYQKIALALDPGKARRAGGIEVDRSGWMIGASEEAMASVGLNSMNNGIKGRGKPKVGGGLDMKDAGLIIAVKDGDDNVFGAFVNERLRPQTSYYGSGEW